MFADIKLEFDGDTEIKFGNTNDASVLPVGINIESSPS